MPPEPAGKDACPTAPARVPPRVSASTPPVPAEGCRKLKCAPAAWGRGVEIDGARPRWEYPTLIITLDAKRRVSIPAALAPANPGDQFEATFESEDDSIILRRVPPKRNWLEVMKACPVPMDDLPPRSREMPKKLKL